MCAMRMGHLSSGRQDGGFQPSSLRLSKPKEEIVRIDLYKKHRIRIKDGEPGVCIVFPSQETSSTYELTRCTCDCHPGKAGLAPTKFHCIPCCYLPNHENIIEITRTFTA